MGEAPDLWPLNMEEKNSTANFLEQTRIKYVTPKFKLQEAGQV